MPPGNVSRHDRRHDRHLPSPYPDRGSRFARVRRGRQIVASEGKSAVGTLVERAMRFAVLLHLPHDRTAQHVLYALAERITEPPQALPTSLPWGSAQRDQRACTLRQPHRVAGILPRSTEPSAARRIQATTGLVGNTYRSSCAPPNRSGSRRSAVRTQSGWGQDLPEGARRRFDGSPTPVVDGGVEWRPA